MAFDSASSTDRIQSRLLALAALFLFLFSILLTLSPAGRVRDWDASLRWDHWLGYVTWVLLFATAHRVTMGFLPDRDPYLLPVGALMSGWGMLTVWRLMPGFGQRQSLWLVIAVLVLMFGMRLPSDLGFLKRYKYVLLTGGLLLTALTLWLGTNPTGATSPRLWLGGLGVYLQPSEPLKLLLLVYLAAYLSGSGRRADVPVLSMTYHLLPLLAPTLVMTGMALVLLVFQRDLGTATVFLFLYAVMVYVASGRKIILAMSGAGILAAGAAGYILFDVVRIRVDAWINPWLDPSGRSFQIVQSLLAVANGGLFGRGPGMGNPALVPVQHSDFIFAALTEESGLFGAVGLLTLLALLAARGLRSALFAPDHFSRYLAAGLTAHLVGQSVLIIGGNLRLLPLTGVTLPFVSYGGSSLLTSFVSLLLLLHISSRGDGGVTGRFQTQPFMHLALFLWAGLAAAALVTGWWAVYRSPELLARNDNARRTIADRYVARGAILDRDLNPLVDTLGRSGSFTRTSFYPHLGSVTGYSHAVYGQSGLEASLDPFIRGLQGHSIETLWWNHLLYGQPPYGLDIRTSLDLDLQRMADELLRSGAPLGENVAYNRQAALVLMNARTGQVLVMASHPNFDPTDLDEQWAPLVEDRRAPLFNRATQGQYPPGAILGPLLYAASYSAAAGDTAPALPDLAQSSQSLAALECAVRPASLAWSEVLAAGCQRPVSALGQHLDQQSLYPNDLLGSSLLGLFSDLGFYELAEPYLPSGIPDPPQALPDDTLLYALGSTGLRISPLQLARAAAAISSGGMLPTVRLGLDVNLPGAGWSPLVAPAGSRSVLEPQSAAAAAAQLSGGGALWSSLAVASLESGQTITWYMGGVQPGAGTDPLVVVVLLEETNPSLASQVGELLLQAAQQP